MIKIIEIQKELPQLIHKHIINHIKPHAMRGRIQKGVLISMI